MARHSTLNRFCLGKSAESNQTHSLAFIFYTRYYGRIARPP